MKGKRLSAAGQAVAAPIPGRVALFFLFTRINTCHHYADEHVMTLIALGTIPFFFFAATETHCRVAINLLRCNRLRLPLHLGKPELARDFTTQNKSTLFNTDNPIKEVARNACTTQHTPQ